jgi:DDE superfamily endonuclease
MDSTLNLGSLLRFRLALHASFSLRADALFELIDALLWSPTPHAPVELSQTAAFRRTFASVYGALRHGQLDREAIRQTWHDAEPPEAITVGGYAVYGLDSTSAPRPAAATLLDRSQVYSAEREGTLPGHQFSWLGHIIAHGQSWLAPRSVERMPTAATPAEVGAQQVQALAQSAHPSEPPKAVVVDSGDAKRKFLQALVGLTAVCVLVRLACKRVLYGAPPPKTGRPGAPKKHGAKFSLKAPPAPERQEQFTLGDYQVRLSAWGHLHFKFLPSLVGLVVRVEFLRADGRPRDQCPLWLFWSGPEALPLRDLAGMYLLRFGIEHFFRFLKQQLGLLCAHTPELGAEENWVWLVALAYWQLLLAREVVTPVYRPWDPAGQRTAAHLTPGQVKQAWAVFSHELGTPAAAPRPSGKGTGRATGYQPEPRERHPVVKKAEKSVVATA